MPIVRSGKQIKRLICDGGKIQTEDKRSKLYAFGFHKLFYFLFNHAQTSVPAKRLHLLSRYSDVFFWLCVCFVEQNFYHFHPFSCHNHKSPIPSFKLIHLNSFHSAYMLLCLFYLDVWGGKKGVIITPSVSPLCRRVTHPLHFLPRRCKRSFETSTCTHTDIIHIKKKKRIWKKKRKRRFCVTVGVYHWFLCRMTVKCRLISTFHKYSWPCMHSQCCVNTPAKCGDIDCAFSFKMSLRTC